MPKRRKHEEHETHTAVALLSEAQLGLKSTRVPEPFEVFLAEQNLSKDDCWACEVGLDKLDDEIKSPATFALWEMYRNHVDGTKPEALWEAMHQYHKHYICDPQRERKFECKDWPAAMVRAHFLHHAYSPEEEVRNSIKLARSIEAAALAQIHFTEEQEASLEEEDPDALATGSKRKRVRLLNVAAVDALFKATAWKMRWMQMDPTKLVGARRQRV